MEINIPGYLTVKQAADIIGCSASRIYQHVKAERLPAYKLGGTICLSEEEVKAFDNTNRPGRQHSKQK